MDPTDHLALTTNKKINNLKIILWTPQKTLSSAFIDIKQDCHTVKQFPKYPVFWGKVKKQFVNDNGGVWKTIVNLFQGILSADGFMKCRPSFNERIISWTKHVSEAKCSENVWPKHCSLVVSITKPQHLSYRCFYLSHSMTTQTSFKNRPLINPCSSPIFVLLLTTCFSGIFLFRHFEK